MTNFAYGRTKDSYRAWKSITPADGSDLNERPRGLIATGAGNIAIRDGAGNDIIITVSAYEVIPFSPVRILSTGTTATGIHILL